MTQCRNSLFTLLGPALSYKCKLSPTVQLHLWRTYSLPVLTSGLSALPIRPAVMKTLQIFQNKILRGFLKLSNSSPVPSLYFLCGELPIEARLHLDLLSLFFNIWSNPQTTIFTIVLYIMKMAGEKSTTWSFHLRLICQLYALPDPLELMQQPAMSKSAWKTLVTTRVTAYHEAQLRQIALKNSNLTYLNVQLLGLNGRPHPAILNIAETREAFKLRAHLKFLTGDFLSFSPLSTSGESELPRCRLCAASFECTQHILTECRCTSNVRDRLFPELLNLLADIQPTCDILVHGIPNSLLTQFILDPTSMNLPNSCRISILHPRLHELYRLSRDWCYAVSRCKS